MQTNDVNLILEDNNIKILEKLKFTSEKETLDFLKKINEILNNKINLCFIDNSLKETLMKIELNQNNLSKLKKINFKSHLNIAEGSYSNKKLKRIYHDFQEFLLTQTNTIKNELYIKKNDFQIDKDSIEKAKKFKVEILFDYKQPGKKNTVNDFILYFNKRLEHFTSILEDKIDNENLIRTSSIKDMKNQKISLIGLISEMNYTKNGHLIITLEDKSASAKCFINKNKLIEPSFKNKIENLCLDQGIGIHGQVGDDIIWVDDIIISETKNNTKSNQTKEENLIACLGDLHIGSRNFVDESFEKFLIWINSKTRNEKLDKLAKKIKYIIITGDMIEGLGIYPGQGKNAKILSTEMQYNKAAQLLSKIPKDKCIINISGNHDTNRLSEPQQKLPYSKSYALYNLPNFINLSNPSIIRLYNQLTFYLYHGSSLLYYANQIKQLREKGGAKVPEEIVKFLLDKQHIAPSHGSTLYIPDSQQDPLKINELPDFFVTGHTHKISITNHKGCNILCTGCWVTISDYQEKMGLYPDTGKCILINTKTKQNKIINFFKE